MKHILLLIGLSILNGLTYAQITMSGNSQHNFFYENQPLKSIKGISWQFKTAGKGANVPMVVNGVIYSGDDKGNLYALDCNTGKEIWRFMAGSKLHDGPSIKDQIAYIGTAGGVIYAIDISTGEEKWRIQTNGSVCNPPALADSLGFALSHDKKLYIFNLETGLIKDTVPEKYILCGTPSIFKDNLYYPDWGGNFHCRNIISGKTDLIYQTGVQSKWFTSPSISDSVAYIVNYDSNLYAVNLKDGREIWRFKADGKLCRAPSISDDLVIFTTTDSHLYALSRKNGNLLWDYRSTGTSWSYPVIAQDVVYFGCGNGNLYALDIHSGNMLWNYTSDQPINTPVLKDGALYFTSGQYIIKIE